MFIKAFSTEAVGEKKEPEIQPRKMIVDPYDRGKQKAFLMDLQMMCFGGYFDGDGENLVKVERTHLDAARKRFETGLQGYILGPQISARIRQKARQEMALKAFTTKGDYPDMVNRDFAIMQGNVDYDTQYEDLFEPAMKDPGREFFEIAVVTRGFKFTRKAEGEKVAIEGMTGDKYQVQDAWFASAIGWTEQAVRYRRLQQIVDEVAAFQDAMQERRSGDYYGMINAAGALNETFVNPYNGSSTPQTTVPDTTGVDQNEKDARTLNQAYVSLLKRFYGVSGYGAATGGRSVYLVFQPDMQERIHGALVRRYQAFVGAETISRFPITPIMSMSSSLWSAKSANSWYMIIPGMKNKKYDEMQPTTFQDRDVYSLTYATIVWMAYSGCVAAAGQIQNGSFT